MFDSNSRQILEEMLGYERYVLRECGDAIRTEQGISGPVRLVINDVVPHMILLSMRDTMGDIGAGMVRKMSPLVFTASFKMLDMILEWTISENGTACPFQFDKKIDIIDNNSNILYPDFLGTDALLRRTTISLYKTLTPYRNAIIHNRWGQARQGTLDFDFHRKGSHYNKSVTFDEVLALADISELLGTMLVHQSSDNQKLDSLRFLYNQISSLHGQPPFAITQPRYFQVIRRTVMPQTGYLTVDLDGVKAKVYEQSTGKPATFDLMVVAEASPRPIVWKIPFSNIPASTSLTLDENWDRFLADATDELKSIAPFFKQGCQAES